jgi:predicted kinase
MENSKPILYIFSGLPATGKTTLAKIIARRLHAVYIRIDTIEQGLRDLCNYNVQGEGYRLAYRLVEDNLIIGNNVVADQCNPYELTRNEWNNVAIKNNCEYINIEIICSNKTEHKNRVENRKAEIENIQLPTWEEIIKRESDKNYPAYYEPWKEEHIIIDTANKSIEECVKELMEKTIL